MDFWSYIANGGLERLLIIGVATLIGYWGYRIYSRSQTPGLALIALSAVMLFSVILTSKQHLQTMNDNLLALATVETPVAAVPETIHPEPAALPAAAPAATEADETDSAAAEIQIDDATATDLETTAANTVAAAEGDEAVNEAGSARIERLVPLASGQELGGRITSVRSENVTLEWSDSDSRRVIRPVQTP